MLLNSAMIMKAVLLLLLPVTTPVLLCVCEISGLSGGGHYRGFPINIQPILPVLAGSVRRPWWNWFLLHLDLTCLSASVQVWELSSGELLLSVLFDVEIMSVTTDPSEYFLFCGGSDGNIFQVSLCSQVSLAEGPPPEGVDNFEGSPF